VLREVRDDRALKMLPVVILTSARGEPDLVTRHDLGVNTCAVKPFVFPNFIEAVKGLGVFWAVTNQRPPDLSVFQESRLVADTLHSEPAGTGGGRCT
jgi:DNA-binding response OmpR family regulator